MRCSNCGSENPAGKKFCSDCGAQLPKGCPQCGAANSSAARFCGDCGAPLSTPVGTPARETSPIQPREIAGERRHLTVLFCDLAGSTEISAQLDPEEWRELAADYHRAAAEVITRFGGYVAKYLGDGVLAYFGWPEAHDNDAERAARAGLAMIDTVGALNRRDAANRRPKLGVRIGIDSGICVIGESHGSEAEIFGDTVNIASRVQSAADPDTVLISAASNRLISGLFVVEERGTRQLKGIAQPLRLYRIVQLSGARGRLQAAALSGLTPFVGRQDELRHLMNRWERTREGQGQVVAITGEAGIGKSRLVHRFREQAESTLSSWIECATTPSLQNTPFHAVTDMLQQVFGRSDDENADECIAAMEASFRLAEVKLPEAVALIAPLLNLPVPEKYPPLSMAPGQQRKRLLATLLAWLFGLARVRPLVIVIEDLHWVDPSTLELIRLLVEQGANEQLLLLYTARPEFRAPWTPRTHHSHLSISRLSARNAREMVHQLVARKALSQEAVARVTERTGGVPLFVEELTHALLEKGDAKPTVREIPATLHDSLMGRLDRLGPGKEVAQIASVIGREFSYQLLQAVSAVSEDDLQSALAKLADTALIYATGFPPEATYSFKHALIRDAAYEALLKTKRKRVHERVARALEMQFSETAETQPELLAHHYAEAGLSDGAISYWHKAGQRAAQSLAHLEAVAHLRRGLESIEMLPDAQERRERELALQTTLGPVLIATKGYGAGSNCRLRSSMGTLSAGGKLFSGSSRPVRTICVLRGAG